MDTILKNLLIGSGSVFSIFQIAEGYAPRRLVTPMIRLPAPPKIMTAEEAAAFDAMAIMSDWQCVGNGLRSAAVQLNDRP